jgi:succinyl-CoA synthetase beta subunit
VIDDAALPRQPEIASLLMAEPLAAAAQKAREAHLLYVPLYLQGQVGAIVNGSGAGMALMDMLQSTSAGTLRLSSFIDLQSRETLENLVQAFHVLRAEPSLRAVIVTLFSGYVKADDLATLLTQAIAQVKPDYPLVLRIEGMGAEAVQDTLRRIPGVKLATTLTDAVSIAHSLLKGQPNVYPG